MPLVSQSVSDNQYYWYRSILVPSGNDRTIADFDYQFFGALPYETISDARRRYILTNVPGALATDSLSDLDRKYYGWVIGPVNPGATNQDAEYLVYKGLAPPSQASNLLTANQASVETDTAGFVASTATITRDPAAARHGSYGLKRVETGTAQWSSSVETTVTPGIVPGQTYTATFDGRVVSGALRGFFCTLQWRSAPDTVVNGGPEVTIYPTTTWNTFTLTGVAPPGAAYAVIQIWDHNAGAVGDTTLWDKFGIWKGTGGAWNMPGEPIDFNKYNLLTANQASAGEDGTINGFNSVSGYGVSATTSVVGGAVGSRSMQFTSTTIDGFIPATNPVAIAGNTVITMTCSAFSQISGNAHVTCMLLDSVGTAIDGWRFGPGIPIEANKWTDLSIYTTTTTANTVYICVGALLPFSSIGLVSRVDRIGLWEGTGGNWAMPGTPITGVS
jgi:hypothetical protein